MVLHTLNAAPATTAFHDCLRIADAGDAIVLLGDAVYAAIDTAALTALGTTRAQVYILGVEASAAGISQGAAKIDTLDMDGFVALSEEYPRQQAWY